MGLLFLSLVSPAQPTASRYMFPINPGTQNYLAGTMGELRGSHFHGGIDIKTGGQTGLPVHATMDGYISRISISTGGYGHSLYLTHPDGNTSVYAHLERFEPALEAYLRSLQYEQQTYTLQDFPDAGRFRYKRGDIIAYSGNTGSSTGPHLHFEIRDKYHRFLNPLDFGFDEIKDNSRPIVKSIAFLCLDKEARINDAYGRYEFEVIYVNGKYTTRKPIRLQGRVGVEIYHYDHLDGTYNRNGIPEITFLLDGDTVFHQIKKRMSFGANRNILVHTDYQAYQNNRSRYNKLFVDEGNDLDIYLKKNDGTYFHDRPYQLEIVLRDSHNNVSALNTTVNNHKIVYPETPSFSGFEVVGNVIQWNGYDSTSTVYYGYNQARVSSYLHRKGLNFFLWDLRQGLPDSMLVNGNSIRTNYYVTVPSGVDFSFYNSDFDLQSSKSSLFDTVYLRFAKSYDTASQREVFAFQNATSPVRNSLKVVLKPQQTYGPKTAVYSVYGSRLGYIGGTQTPQGNFEFSTRDLVSFTLAQDTIPPQVTPISWLPSSLRFKIDDERSGIRSYRATLNGSFLLMQYEPKKDLLWAVPHDSMTKLSGEFILRVEDNQGNITELTKLL